MKTKKLLFGLLTFLLLFGTTSVKAQTTYSNVEVRGTVTDANGTLLNNHPVQIYAIDSLVSPWPYDSTITYTDTNGFYIDTLYWVPSSASMSVGAETVDCNGTTHVRSSAATTSTPGGQISVTHNFVICGAPSVTCNGMFFSYPDSNAVFGVDFYGSTATGGGASTTHSWDFGDGTTGSTSNSNHVYSSAGTYWVCHTITKYDASQNVLCTDTYCDSVAVTNSTILCNAFFNSSTSGLTANFSSAGSSANTTSYSWDFGDGNISSAQHPSHTYASSGTYTVILTIGTGSTCTDIYTGVVTVTAPVPCNAIFYAIADSSNPTGAGGYSISFNDVSAGNPISWYWDFGDGYVDSSNTSNPNHTYSSIGWYYVCLTISNGTCVSTICDSIYIDSNFTVQAIFNYQQVGNNTVQFTNGSTQRANMSYYWDFGDGNFSTQMSPSHTYAGPGNYTVCLTAVDNATNVADMTCISNIDPSAVVSITENNINAVKVYPNPVQGVLNIEAENVNNVKIYNTTGILILDTDATSIDMSNYDNGLYIIQLTFDNQETKVQRIIKAQ